MPCERLPCDWIGDKELALATLKDLPKIKRIEDEDGVPVVVLTLSSYRRFIAAVRLDGSIDEAAYLKANPDVAKAISENRVKSATEHFRRAGYVEQRRAKVVD